MSRPRIKPYGSFNVYLYREQLDWISKEAHRKKINRSEFLRQIIHGEMEVERVLKLHVEMKNEVDKKENDALSTID